MRINPKFFMLIDLNSFFFVLTLQLNIIIKLVYHEKNFNFPLDYRFVNSVCCL